MLENERRPLPVVVAPLEAADLLAVARIDAASFDRTGARSVATAEAQLREELARPWARVRVARAIDDGRIAGYLVAWHVADELHVIHVATDPGERRRGVGRALLGELVEFGRAEDVAHVLLEVRRSNDAAIRLYREAGFRAVHVRRGYYPDHEDAIEMTLSFDPSTRDVVRKLDEVRLETI